MLMALTLISSFVGVMSTSGTAHAQTTSPKGATTITTKSNFCANLGKKYQASSGAQMFCNGPQPSGPTSKTVGANAGLGTNVDAASFAEDVAPSGVRAYGQSEVSVAGVGTYVVEAWNDATAFFSGCGASQYKEEATGFGFSANGGKSFVDQGGLPNANCNTALYGGDPSVEAWQPGGTAYFYISSLYNPAFTQKGPPADARSFIAMDACKATGTGASAQVSCGQPIIIAASSQCQTQNGNTFCSFLDKEYLSIDPVHGRLYASYDEFGFNGSQVELAACDIGTATGEIGPLGGTAGAPVCESGGSGSQAAPNPPYFVVAPPDTNFCENEGAYPAVNTATGDVYVAYEHNWASSLFAFPGNICTSVPVQNVVNYVPASCLTLAATSTCSGPAASNAVNVTSMEAAFIPGYSRFPMNDFPRIAVSSKVGTVSITWNDARFHPAGDILLQSFNLTSLSGVQAAPVRLNSSIGGWHFLPGLRNADASGNLNIAFYGRATTNTAVTNVYAALGIDPRATGVPANTLVTTRSSDWSTVSSDINPNFGDYTDSYVIATPRAPYIGTKLYIAWSDGRLGVPQPFEAYH
ncbi:MAG: hypothetical protein NVS4B11_39050 [Ktedonobacteraceae bacterium]